MKIWNYWKIFNFTKKSSSNSLEGKLALNDKIIDNLNVVTNKLHSETYGLLRKFKTPQYDVVYVMKNKKAFNTLYFNLKYDIIICDYRGKILELLTDVNTGFISDYNKNSHSIYFTVVGTIKHNSMKIDDRLEIRRLYDWY